MSQGVAGGQARTWEEPSPVREDSRQGRGWSSCDALVCRLLRSLGGRGGGWVLGMQPGQGASVHSTGFLHRVQNGRA